MAGFNVRYAIWTQAVTTVRFSKNTSSQWGNTKACITFCSIHTDIWAIVTQWVCVSGVEQLFVTDINNNSKKSWLLPRCVWNIILGFTYSWVFITTNGSYVTTPFPKGNPVLGRTWSHLVTYNTPHSIDLVPYHVDTASDRTGVVWVWEWDYMPSCRVTRKPIVTITVVTNRIQYIIWSRQASIRHCQGVQKNLPEHQLHKINRKCRSCFQYCNSAVSGRTQLTQFQP